jgi:hypothetical protein
MNGHQCLIDRVHQMREAGDSIDQIVLTLDISWEMVDVVRRIARKFETEAVLSARSSRFMEEIRKANDLDKEWKAGVSSRFAVRVPTHAIATKCCSTSIRIRCA